MNPKQNKIYTKSKRYHAIIKGMMIMTESQTVMRKTPMETERLMPLMMMMAFTVMKKMMRIRIMMELKMRRILMMTMMEFLMRRMMTMTMTGLLMT